MTTPYEFYVSDSHRRPRFVPVVCESECDLVRRARELLEQEQAEAVEVRCGDRIVFRLVS